jgi:glutathione S-transferase
MSIQLHYWGVKSRAHAAIFITGFCDKAAEITWNKDISYPGTPEFEAYESKSVLGQLPFLVDGALQLGQSQAISRHLARKFGFGEDASATDKALSDMTFAEADDIFNAFSKAHYAPDGRGKAFDAVFGEGGFFTKHAVAMEGLVGESGFFGSVAMPGDVALASALDLAVGLQADCLDATPKLKALHATVSGTGSIATLTEGLYPYFKRQDD